MNKEPKQPMSGITKIVLVGMAVLGIGLIVFSKGGLPFSNAHPTPTGGDYGSMFTIVLKIVIGVLLLLISSVTAVVKYIIFYIKKDRDEID